MGRGPLCGRIQRKAWRKWKNGDTEEEMTAEDPNSDTWLITGNDVTGDGDLDLLVNHSACYPDEDGAPVNEQHAGLINQMWGKGKDKQSLKDTPTLSMSSCGG